MVDHHHQRWAESGCVERFVGKGRNDFFASETRFIDRIGRELESVLDVGCASGRFIELLKCHRDDFRFCGIDIAEANITSAKQLYPWAEFHYGDALDFEPSGTFDLVNATGVIQHEPRFNSLIQRMLDWSSHYVLFDVKFAAIDRHLVDIDQASAGTHNRLYFIPLVPKLFLDWIRGLPGICGISVYGYPTSVNANVRLPSTIKQIVSAGVLLEKGSGPRREDIILPEGLLVPMIQS
jgi:SAM-dependent methyltransferase